METLLLVGVCVGGVAFVAVLAYRAAFSTRARGRRQLGRTSRTPVAQARPGEPVKVVGRVRFVGESLRAPMSGRRCACWHVRVQQAKQGAQGGSWDEVLDETEGQDFLLEDDTGVALVHGVLPTATLASSGPWIDNLGKSFTPEVERFLAERGESVRGTLGDRGLRFEERTLDEGALTAVLGIAQGEGASSVADRVIDCLDDGRLLVSNLPSSLS